MAQAVNRADGGTTAATTGQAVNFTGTDLTGIVTVANGDSITSVTAAGPAVGTLQFNTTTTAGVAGTTGAAVNTVGLIKINGAAGVNTLTGAAYTNAVEFSADGTLVMNGATNVVTTTVTNTTGSDNKGTLTLGTGSATTLTGNVGGAGAAIKQVNLNGSTAALNGDVVAQGVNFGADGAATLATTKSITGAITTSTTNTGTLNVVGGGATAITGNIGANGTLLKQINVGQTGAVTITGTVYATTLNFAGAQTLTMAGTLNAAVTTSTGGQGILALGNGAAVNGNIGVSGTAINKITVNAAGNGTITGDVYAGTVDYLGDRTLTVAGNLNAVVNATTATAGNGTLTFSSTTTTGGAIGTTAALKAVNFNGAGTSTLNHDISATTTTIASGATLAVGTTGKTITGTLTNNGTLNLGSLGLTQVKNGGTLTLGNLAVTMTSTANGRLTTDVVGVTSGAITVTPTLSGIAVRNNDKFIIVRGAGVANITPGNVTVANSALLSWTVDDGSAITGTDRFNTAIAATDVVMKATVASASTLSGVTSNAATAVNGVTNYTGTNADMVALQNAVNSLSTASSVNDAGQKLRPDAHGASAAAAMQATTQVQGVVASRSDSVRLAQSGGKQGVNTGEAMKGLGFWAEGFGGQYRQGMRDNIDGYAATTAGFAVGGDVKLADAVRAGLALSYANTDVNDKGARTGNGTEIDSYGATLYTSYTGSPWYVDGSVGVSLHKYDTTRRVNFTGFDQTATGSHDGWQYTARVDGGYPLPVGPAVVTPVAGVAYSHLNQDSFTETGASGANLAVDSSTTNSLRSSLGAKVGSTFQTDIGKLAPEFRAVWSHEFMDKSQDVTAAYAAGGSSFTTSGATPAREIYTLGVGMDLTTEDNLTLSANYDLELRDQYVGHTGRLRLRAEF